MFVIMFVIAKGRFGFNKGDEVEVNGQGDKGTIRLVRRDADLDRASSRLTKA